MQIISSAGVACIIGFLVPWLFTIPLQSGEYMKTFVSWTSMLFTSFVNFTLVAKMYLECRNFRIRYVTNRSEYIVNVYSYLYFECNSAFDVY